MTHDKMITINVQSNDNILFKDFNFTLDNKTPTNISLMSMPPTGNWLTTYNKGDNIVITGTTLIKINSINFVISNRINKNYDYEN